MFGWSVQGSGWGWLAFNKASNRLQIAACPNQDPLEATTGLVPLFGKETVANHGTDYRVRHWKVMLWIRIRIQELRGSGSVFPIGIRIHTCKM